MRDVDGHRCSNDRPISFQGLLVTVILTALFFLFQKRPLWQCHDRIFFRMIPVGNDVTRLVLLRDELYEATDVTFELNCDIRLCLMTEKDSICSEEVYDTSLCDKVTY